MKTSENPRKHKQHGSLSSVKYTHVDEARVTLND
jgi:hypothetical protein